MRTLDLIGRLFDRLALLLVGLAAALLVAMALLINVEVLGRYFFSFSTLISDEYSGYFFTWITMLCLLYALRSGRMLSVETLVQRLSPRPRQVLEVLGAGIGVFVCAVMADATWGTLSLSWLFDSRSIQPSQTPLWIPQAVMPAGFALLGLGYLENGLRNLVLLLGGGRDAEQPR